MENTIGARIKMLREAKRASVEDLAKIADVGKSAIYGIEKDANKPSYDVLQRLISHYPDLNPDWLLLGAGPMLRDGRVLTPIEDRTQPDPPALPAQPVAVLSSDELRDAMSAAVKSAEVRLLESERDSLRKQVRTLMDIVGNRYGRPYEEDAPAAAGKLLDSETAAAPKHLGFLTAAQRAALALPASQQVVVMKVTVRAGQELAAAVDYSERFTVLFAEQGAQSGYPLSGRLA